MIHAKVNGFFISFNSCNKSLTGFNLWNYNIISNDFNTLDTESSIFFENEKDYIYFF